MGMVGHEDPHRVYVRNGVAHVCYGGSTYGTHRDATAVRLDTPVIVVANHDGGKSVTVTQRVGDSRRVAEVWKQVDLQEQGT